MIAAISRFPKERERPAVAGLRVTFGPPCRPALDRAVAPAVPTWPRSKPRESPYRTGAVSIAAISGQRGHKRRRARLRRLLGVDRHDGSAAARATLARMEAAGWIVDARRSDRAVFLAVD